MKEKIERPLCQTIFTDKPCRHPARYYIEAPAFKKPMLTCDIHARAFLSKAVHPLRLTDIRRFNDENQPH